MQFTESTTQDVERPVAQICVHVGGLEDVIDIVAHIFLHDHERPVAHNFLAEDESKRQHQPDVDVTHAKPVAHFC